MKIPAWALWMMLISSAIGTYMLIIQLKSMGFPSPLSTTKG